MIKILLLFFAFFNSKDITVNELEINSKNELVEKEYQKVPGKANYIRIKFDPNILKDEKLYLAIESSDKNLSTTFFKTNEESNLIKSNQVLKIPTYSGNSMFVLSDTYFKGKMEFIKKNQAFIFSIKSSSDKEFNFKIRVQIGNSMDLDFDKVFTSRIDSSIDKCTFNWIYNGENRDIYKLRFQAIALIHKDNYSMKAFVGERSDQYKMNWIFKHILGGIIDSDHLSICKQQKCEYKMDLYLQGVKQVNIEAFLVEKVQKLSIYHYEEYYDKSYSKGQQNNYVLPYVDDMEGMNISINLIPVTGETSLYVNARTLPLSLDKYDYKEVGSLAKRVTISWDELIQNKAEKSDLFITVVTQHEGEFLLKIDAHEDHFRGRLSSGISEAGFIKSGELANYLYTLKVYQTQEIQFTTKLKTFTGEAYLYLKQCEDISSCKVTKDDLGKDFLLKVENKQIEKEINHKFECQALNKNTLTSCPFLVVIYGKEDHGTHFELIVQEDKYHTLMITNHSLDFSLNPSQVKYLKYSYPGKYGDNQLFLSIEPNWGDFTIYIDKEEQFPDQDKNQMNLKFNSESNSFYNQHKNISIYDNFGPSIQGVYYIAIEATTSSSLSFKFYQKSEQRKQVHTLTSGNQLKGQLDGDQILYYTIKVSLENNKASSVSIDLVPIRGKFVMFASRIGKFPTKDQNEKISYDNHLDLIYQNYNDNHEYIIGIQSLDTTEKNQTNQFRISLSYSDKPNKLLPQVLSTYKIRDKNIFIIEVIREMENLMILKTINDGFNIKLCAEFSQNEVFTDCDQESNDKKVSIYYEKETLLRNCQQYFDINQKCFIHLKVKGFSDQKFTLGFTYNDLPFNLLKAQMITGPAILNQKKKIKFIYHPDANQPLILYFNTKIQRMKIYTKLIQTSNLPDGSLKFPTKSDYDESNLVQKGYISNVYYSKDQVQNKGDNPELLISIETEDDQESNFDLMSGFLLQAYVDNQEILRTHVETVSMQPDNWRYFYFYNNGNSKYLKVHVSSDEASMIKAVLARGRDSRPPFDQRPLLQKEKINSLILELDDGILGKGYESYKGYYTLAVQTKQYTKLHIYWNNKDNLNYTELTPNYTTRIHIQKSKPLYFTFFTELLDKDYSINIHAQSDVQCKVHILKSENHELFIPGDDNFSVKGSFGKNGGIQIMSMSPKATDYCKGCTYVGAVQTEADGHINLVVNFEIQDEPVFLNLGQLYPDKLKSHQSKLFRYSNEENSIFYINLSFLHGHASLYIGESAAKTTARENKYLYLSQNKEKHKFIQVNPKDMGFSSKQDIYIRLENTKLDNCQYTITLNKDDIESPIQRGVTKQLELSNNQQIHLYFQQIEEEKEIELRLQLRSVESREQIELALQNINKMVRMTYKLYDKEIEVNYKKIIINEQNLYAQYDVSNTQNGLFTVELNNPNDFGINLSIDIISEKYKLMNMHQEIVDFVGLQNQNIYESLSQAGKFWFMEMRMCSGKTNVSIYQSDYQNLEQEKFVEYKTVEDNNSYVHYFRLTNDRVFVKVNNKKVDKSFYSLKFYNEEELNENPYQEIMQQSNGQVQILTDSKQVRFQAVRIKNFKSESYIHKVKYQLFLADDFKVMRYLKNCSTFLIDQAFVKPQYHQLNVTKIYNNTQELNDQKDITIDLPKLDKNKKLYGILVVDLHLLPKEEGWIEPIRQGKAYYDEFIMVSSKMQVPFSLMTYVVLLLAFFGVIVILIRSYVYSDLDGMQGGLHKFTNITNNTLGIDTLDILNSEFDAPVEKKETELDTNKEVTLEGMDDKSAPLDLDM